MSNTVYGYIRVSTREQKEDRSVLHLRAFRCRRRIHSWISSAEKILTGRNTGSC